MWKRSFVTASRPIHRSGTDCVGLILDTSVVIAAERRGHSVRQILEQLQTSYGEIDLGLSVITIAELTHGAYRSGTDADRRRRLAFIERLSNDIPVHPLSLEIASKVGRIEGEQAAIGISVGFQDLAIGVTAMSLGFDVATLNVRHFALIPGLKIATL